MRLYGALSELAELIIRLASGKTVKVSASEQTAAGETIVTIPDVVDGADEFVMKDTQQTLTKKVLSGTVTTAGDTDKTSDMVITAADITANKIVMPSLQNNNDRPDDKNVKGAMHLSADTLVIVGNGTGYQTLVDMSSSQTLQQKTLNADVNSISNLNPAVSTTFKTVAGHADKVVKYDNSGVPQVAKIVNANIDDAAGIAGSKLSDNSVAAAKLASMTSADLAGKITDETGSGALVFANNPTIGSITAASGILSLSGTGALKIPAGTQAERPNSPVEGMIRYNSETDSFEGYASNAWSGIGGGGTVDRIAQLSHGFVVGDVLYLNGAVYAKAKADAANTAEVVGMVSRVIDVDNFEMTLSGEVAGLTGLTAGEVYFLSPSTAGALTVTEPSVVGQVSLPVGVASSTTSLYVAPKRGVVVGGANLRTQIGLNGAALVSQITTIQNVSAYEAGELAGWVTIDATTDYKFYVQAQFVKNSAGTDWNLAFQTTGETPPAGFSMNITTGGAIQVTLPPIAGFSSASINFALNAPAVGTSLPLQVNSSNITWQSDQTFRNALINGNFDVWQRGTSGTNSGANLGSYPSADRWRFLTHTAGVGWTDGTLTQNTDTPSSDIKYSVKVVSTSAALDDVVVFQTVEAVNAQSLAGKPATLSFWCKKGGGLASAKTFKYAVRYLNTADVGTNAPLTMDLTTLIQEATINSTSLSSSWTKITMPIPAMPSQAANGVIIEFRLDDDNLGSGDLLFLSQVQLEAGPVATPFERRPYSVELQMCQRYYVRGTSTAINDIPFIMTGAFGSSTTLQAMFQYPCPMRAVPSFNRNGLNIANGAIAYGITSFIVNGANTTGAQLAFTASAGTFTAGQGGYVYSATVGHWFDASAEL